ncbi:RagB/SusD family nutrient uptake outer membrane protein [Polaribacter porphyrae]|uniref:RagB/SusD family nutrient uptake outer membrane protein n=1 Tax=Polaribacter porphyrae TaxID=1137780 RepID=A0A2S7WNM1_9FLAO|nr:RagB/SusD family nutrient uptake outer membrane protein [Polaribacter porphyrae]PQJ79208.1 RagB/SusD family nutrient uptake outer membrane protein [Polaribacter porphyrae]
MKQKIIFSNKTSKYFILFLTTILYISCGDFDTRLDEERYFSENHAEENALAGNTQGLKAIDGAILAYFRDGENGAGSTDEFGLKAVDLGMDLRSNDMDMSRNTWFGAYNNYDNVILTSNDNDFIWEFFYRIISNSNKIINSIPDDSPQEVLVFKNKAYAYRAIAYFYLVRIYQHTKADDSTKAIPIDFGTFEGQNRSTVGEVKKQIIDDLTTAYKGLESYSRTSKQEIDANVVAAYLARYYLTYENWQEAEKYADIAMNAGIISSDVSHGFDELSLSEAIWGSIVTPSTSEIYASFFSHVSQINDGYSGWNHFKTANSNLVDALPASDLRHSWFADQDYGPNVLLVPDTWTHYNITPKYTSLKFIAQPGPGQFIGDYIYLKNTEFILTKAEALARQGKDGDAQEVLYSLNSVRNPNYTKSTNTGQALIDEILYYRRVELWGDGVASFDMARLGVGLNRKDGRINRVMPGADLVIPAMDSKMIYQIPIREIDAAGPDF